MKMSHGEALKEAIKRKRGGGIDLSITVAPHDEAQILPKENAGEEKESEKLGLAPEASEIEVPEQEQVQPDKDVFAKTLLEGEGKHVNHDSKPLGLGEKVKHALRMKMKK